MVESSLQESSKRGFTCLKMTVGKGTPQETVRAWTDWGKDRTIFGTLYSSVPEIKISPAEQTGFLKEKETKIELPFKKPFAARIVSGDPIGRIHIDAFEVIDASVGGLRTNINWLHRGIAKRATRSTSGRNPIVTLYSSNTKARMKMPLGLRCDETCFWTFGAFPCFLNSSETPNVDLSVIQEQAEVIGITGNRMSVRYGGPGDSLTVLSPSSIGNLKYWHRGWVSFGGIVIDIYDWSIATPDRFILTRKAPNEWIGETITFTPGCDKTKDT